MRDVAKSQKVAFTGEAAARVARATLAYEQGNRNKSPIRFRQVSDDGDFLKLAKTVGTWTKGTTQAVQLYDVGEPSYETTADPVKTVDAFNKLCTVEANRFVIIGLLSNGFWYLLNWECAGSSGGG